MGNGIVIFFATIMSLLAVGSISYYFYLNRNGEEPENKDLIWLFNTQYTGGHAECVIQDKKFSENRVKLKLIPRDVNTVRVSNGKETIEEYTLFLNKSQFHNSGLSSHRQIYIALPQRMEDLPTSFRETIIGKIMETAITEGNINSHVEKLYKKRIDTAEDLGMEMASSLLVDLQNQTLKEAIRSKEYIRENNDGNKK